MDIVRLAIVYETGQAAARLNGLNRQLGGTHTSTRKLATAAVGLAQSLSTGQVSATALTNRLATLGGKAGTVGIALAVVAGALLLLKRHADRARDAAQKFADQLRTTQRAVNELLRPDVRSPLQGEIEKITDAILELDRVLARQRMNLLERWFGGASPKAVFESFKRFILGGADPATLGQRGALSGERDRLTPEAARDAQRGRFRQELGQGLALNRLLDLGKVDRLNTMLAMTRENLEKLVELGLDPLSEEAVQTAQGIRQLEDNLRRAARAQALLQSGLETMADALGDFIIEGTDAWQQFLNNILRLLYRDVTDELIHGLVRSAGSAGGGTSGSGGIIESGPGSMNPSVQSNVTFNVVTPDASATANWLNQNGPQIAAVVAGQASRSRGLRGKLTRG